MRAKDSRGDRRLAWISALDKDLTNPSSFYTHNILPHLRQFFTVDVFSGEREGEEIFSADDLRVKNVQSPYDAIVYLLDDSQDSDFARELLKDLPGVVIYHDVLRWPRNESGEGTRHDDPYFPHLEFANTTLGICTNQRNLSELRKRLGVLSQVTSAVQSQPQLVYLPFPLAESMILSEASPTEDPPRVVYAGQPRLEDRSHHVLRALARVEGGLEFQWLLDEEEIGEARKQCIEFGIPTRCLIPGRNPARWFSILQGASLALHPYFSVFGDPGVYLPISLAAGVPTVVTDFSVGSLYPDSVCYKIQSGVAETEQLMEILKSLLAVGSPSRGELAKVYALETHSPAFIAGELFELLRV